MKYKIEITVKAENEHQVADALNQIAAQLIGAGFNNAPNDIREMEAAIDPNSLYGFSYDVQENDGTDMYGNEIVPKVNTPSGPL